MFRYLIHFRLGMVEVDTNHILGGIGVGVYILLSSLYLKRKGYPLDMVLKFHVFSLLGVIVGPLVYLLGVWVYSSFEVKEVANRVFMMLQATETNKMWIGGGILSFFYLWKIRKLPRIWNFYDHLFPWLAFLFGWYKTFWCFVFGCCYGRPTRMPWGVVFPPYTASYQKYGDVPLHPVQIYNTIGALIIMGIGFWLLKRKEFDGEVMLWIIFMGGVAKIFEALFGRGDKGAMDKVLPLAIPAVAVTFLLLMSIYFIKERDTRKW